jgi:hypothetical protein
MWTGIVVAVIVCTGLLLVIGTSINRVERHYLTILNPRRSPVTWNRPNPGAALVSGRPILWTNTTQTVYDAQRRDREFRQRQWVDGYEQHGERNSECDADADLFLKVFLARNYGGPEATNPMSLEQESDKLANDPNCKDPLVLTVAADETISSSDAVDRFDRALAAYPNSHHEAYPQIYGIIELIGRLGNNSSRVDSLETSALTILPKAFTDGSFTPADQRETGEIFINGWGARFFKRHAMEICNIVKQAGPDYKWLALTLDGEREINEAWAVRGSGYSDSVSSEGWRGFNSHLANARGYLTAAWMMHPDWPLAPERLITVSLGDSDLSEMRKWFDQATLAQIDYPRAWSDFRWGLRPRWYGNEQAILALGVAAINTGRFDTDVPRKYIDGIYDVESELGEPRGQHIFGRPDIWPNLARMYEGYINAPSQQKYVVGWRTSYAIVAYVAKKYDVARVQLEALNWEPRQTIMADWGLDATYMPLEVAARTGSLGSEVTDAEFLVTTGDVSGAIRKYKAMQNDSSADARTHEYIGRRLAELLAQ